MMPKRTLLIVLLLIAVILAPDFVFNLFPPEVPYGWLGSRFLSGTFDLSKQVLPPVYQEVRQWLDTQVRPGDVFRLFWLPVDPSVISTLEFLYPDTPLFFPRFDERNYTQMVFDYINNAPNLGWHTGLGKMLAYANVKYVIVNLSANDGGAIWKQQGPPSLSPWGPSYDLRYYFTGDPKGYEQLLDQEQRLKPLLRVGHFVLYENLDFVPYFTAYRSSYFVLPTSTIDQRIPTFSLYNYSNNLVQNGGFENGFQPWGLEGNHTLSTLSHSGTYSLEANRTMQGWIAARQDVLFPDNASYYLSGWMKAQNVKQSHLKLTFYNSTGDPILTTYPLSGIDGTWDWRHVSEAGVSPKGTHSVGIFLMGGWSLDNENPGLTWFDDISFVEGYYPNPSPIHFWAYPILMGSSVGGLLSDIPTFGGASLVVSTEAVSPSTISDESLRQFGQASSGLILMGDPLSNSTLSAWIDQSPRLMFVYEPESVLQPENGRWEHLHPPSIGTPEGVMVTGVGQGSQDFFVPRNSNYTIAIHVVSNGKITLRMDSHTLGSELVRDSIGQSTSWYQSDSIPLGYGEHRMTVITNSSSSIVDKIVMLSSIGKTFRLQDLAPGVAPSISFSKTSSTHYALQISSEGPVFVLFGETYDASWNARIGNVVLNHQSVPFHMYWSTLYTSANLSQTKVEVNFDQQEQRNAIITIWGVGWLLSLSYVSFASRERIVRLSRKLKSRRKTRA
jgi:hypothetical protein